MISPKAGFLFGGNGVVVEENGVFICNLKGRRCEGFAVDFDTASFDEFLAREEFCDTFACYLFACFILHS